MARAGGHAVRAGTGPAVLHREATIVSRAQHTYMHGVPLNEEEDDEQRRGEPIEGRRKYVARKDDGEGEHE